jgi:hypothetical protein
MSISTRTILLFLTLFCLSSCADYELHYANKAEEWETDNVPPDEKPVHTVYLIGDAGGGEGPALQFLKQKLDQETIPGTVVFLGDNIYPNGLGDVGDVDRELDIKRLEDQLRAVKDFEGNIHFVAGNHDWYRYGLEGVKRQKKHIESFLGREDVLLPKPGCGEPEEIELTDDLVLILIDSQWYLTNWEDEYKINAGCEIKSRALFEEYMLEAIKGNRNKNIIIAMHHPPYTYGSHGGYYTAKQHFFPLTDLKKKLYIPFPLVGSMLQFVRGTIGHRQDAMHPMYRELADIVISAARRNGRFVIASGHEHSLQHIEKDEQFFIVSGSGSKQSPVHLGSDADFAYAHQGFAQLNYYEDGSYWVTYWAANYSGEGGRVVYRKQLKGPLPKEVEEVPKEFEPIPASVKVPLSEENFDRGALWNFLWGQHYRKAYNAEVEVPTLDLTTYKGGVRPVKRGGGFQTNSLRLEADNGRQYVMRSIDKDATRTLAYPFNNSIVTEVVKDNFSAAHPMAAVSAAALAKEAGIYYTDPKLYYVPPQPALGSYNEDYADALYLVEERPDDEVWRDAEQFGKPHKIRSTLDVREEIIEEHDEIIDYRWVVRTRIFDALINDWDRHGDQWRWAEFKGEEIDSHRPIPRDRDQAFSKYDGFIVALLKGASPEIKRLLVYSGKARNIKWLLFNGRHFDRTFLSGAEWEIWKEETEAIQLALTDKVIEKAFKEEWPEPLYELDGEELIQKVKERRDNLLKISRKFYDFVSEKVDVIGTEKKDYFRITYEEPGVVRVRVYDTNDDGDKEYKFYDRTFLASETREIMMYALKDDDIFKIEGRASGQKIKIRMIGGLGDDQLIGDTKGRKLYYYDAEEEKTLVDERNRAKLRLKKDVKYNTYNRESKDYDFNYWSILPAINFNPDDRLLLGAYGTYTSFGFKKDPYAVRHTFRAVYAPYTGGAAFDYGVEFTDAIGNWELGLDMTFQTPLYAANFYGLGNDSVNPEVLDDDADPDFNRVKQRLFRAYPALIRRLNDNSRLMIGPTFESIRIDRTPGRFIDEIGDQFDPEMFDGLEFVGARLFYEYKNADNIALPTRGIGLQFDAGWKQQLDDQDKSFAYLDATVSFYQYLDIRRKLTAATRFGYQHRYNEDYEFFQGASLGGPGPNANFRGFRRDRFIGTTAFWQNIDLRWRLVDSDNPTIPFSFGILGGFDHGRVWLDGEDSNTWHYSYGGGIWFSPFNLFAINFSAFRGDGKETRLLFTGGFFF